MDQFSNRKYVIGAIIIFVGIVFVARLLYMQVIDPTYQLSAEANSRRVETVYPARGLIYDRNGELLVHNQPSYDLKIARFELQPFDSTELCDMLGIDIQVLRDGIQLIKKYPSKGRDPFIKQLSPDTFGKLKEKQY